MILRSPMVPPMVYLLVTFIYCVPFVQAIDCGVHYQCATGDQCVRYIYHCNGVDDCDDGSDEFDCICDLQTEYQCEAGQCINRTLLCTGRVECWDGSDERDCPTECGSRFRCRNGASCVPYIYRCNGYNDCDDGSDEHDCLCDTLSHHYQCADDVCIARASMCNGVPECNDASDERDCPCDNDEYHCITGGCIPSTLQCNGIPDCNDLSDEINCNCGWNQFRCSISGTQCIPLCKQCDGIVDCNDYTDETNCSCPENWFRCSMYGQCIPPCKRCDGREDCVDGSDESSCVKAAHVSDTLWPEKPCSAIDFWCTTGEECVATCARCDGLYDCQDKSDEFNCNCTTNQFRCDNGQCIPSVARCDVNLDCFDNSDEAGCPDVVIASAVCSPVVQNLMVPSGYLISPLYPDAYPSNSNCKWRIIAPDNGVVRIASTYFQIPSTDSVTLYDGFDSRAPIIATLYGYVPPSSATSTQRYVYITFSSYAAVDEAASYGFTATFSVAKISPACFPISRPLNLNGMSGIIVSPFFPGTYDATADCHWRIESPDSTGKIRLTFNSVNLTHASNFFTLYDGVDSTAPMIATISGVNNSVEAVYRSTQRYMYVTFTSERTEDVVNSYGFMATFTVLSIPPACVPSSRPMSLNAISGSIFSPLYPDNYIDNADCQWILRSSSQDTVISLVFSDFFVEFYADFVCLYDGDSTSYPLLANLTGVTRTSYTSSQRYMLVTFTSNGNKTYSGFNITFSSVILPAACSSSTRPLSLTDGSGIIVSPNYPNQYMNNADCQWLIVSQLPSTVVSLVFTTGRIEYAGDRLYIYDGNSISSTPLGTLSGSWSSISYTSSQPYMLVRFLTDSINTYIGFHAMYSSVSLPATQTACSASTRPLYLTSSTGTLTSPYYPANYPNNAECQWLIVAPSANMVVSLVFTIDSETEVFTDIVNIYDGNSTSSVRLADVSGFPSTSGYSTSQRYMFIRFTSNARNTFRGFNATYSAVFLPAACFSSSRPVVLTNITGIVTSPIFPNKNINDADCQWLIVSPTIDGAVLVEFTTFITFTRNDYITLYDAQNSSSTPIVTIRDDGSTFFLPLPRSYITSQRYALIRFTSAGYHSNEGYARFSINYAALNTADCPSSQFKCTVQKQCISSTKQCDGTCDCTSCTDERNCTCDTQQFYCSANDRCIALCSRCNGICDCPDCQDEAGCPGPSDNMCSSTDRDVTSTSGTLTSPNFPNNYTNNADCRWRIIAPTVYSVVTLVFGSLSTERCCDWVRMYDGFDATARLLGQVAGNLVNATYKTTQRYLYVRFSSDGSVTSTGFSATYSSLGSMNSNTCSSTGRNLTGARGTFTSPNYPNSYPNNANCQWRIIAPSSTGVVTLSFSAFSTEGLHDFVSLYDGFDVSFTQIATLSGTLSTGAFYTTTQRYMFVKFTSDYSSVSPGFSATYTTPGAECDSQFSCVSTGTCIRSCLQCNGMCECTDCSDERNCTCTARQFKCRLADRCLPVSNQCDGLCQCPDCSDESGCPCSLDKYRCPSTDQCLPLSERCDGVAQCQNNEDEQDCAEFCAANQRHCLNGWCLLTRPLCQRLAYFTGKRCSSTTFWCDGYSDCPDGSDEINCTDTQTQTVPTNTGVSIRQPTVSSRCISPGQYQCANGYCLSIESSCAAAWCRSYNFRCDRFRDCADGSDERNCVATTSPVCRPGQFQCDDNVTCLRRDMWCNGITQCPDGSDEINCPCSDANQYQCANGQCIHSYQRCNLFVDCADGSDESSCNCTAGSFRCNNGDCVTVLSHCTGDHYCSDYSDQINCSCGYQQFQCRESFNCISQCKVCDGESDCGDGSDEEDCTSVCNLPSQFRCTSGECITSCERCDGTAQCADGSDEINCTCSYNEFRCSSDGSCISNCQVCDGGLQCPDGSDERNCELPAITASSVLPGGDLRFINQGTRFKKGQLFGNNVTSKSYDLRSRDVQGSSFIDADTILPAGYLSQFYIYLSAADSDHVDSGPMWLEIWRPYNVSIFQWQLVWHQQVESTTQLDALHVFALNRYQVKTGDRIGWRFEGTSGMISFNFNGLERTYISRMIQGTPQVGQTLQFEGVPIAGDFSVAVLVETDTYNLTTPYSEFTYAWTTSRTEPERSPSSATAPYWAYSVYTSYCTADQFQCPTTGFCIPSSYECDGRCDCLSDCGDETNCNCSATDQFHCQSPPISCISSSFRCDSYCQCSDCSDEINCPCEPNGMRCNNGRCYLPYERCDGVNNCGDLTDEINCGTCNLNERRCGVGICVNTSLWCNGIIDCPDGSDESLDCSTTPCNNRSFTCNNGRCINTDSVCDGVNDCGDISDEYDCNCTSTSYRCRMGLCVLIDTWCDGYRDCPDKSDELPGCNTTCPAGSGARRCIPLQKCIPSIQICDSVQHCPDDSDEVNCTCRFDQYRCINGRCINRKWLCDGIIDCPLEDDEASCSGCLADQFRCRQGTCISCLQECDGVAQCPDASDEDSCLSLSSSTNELLVKYLGSIEYNVCADNWNTEYSDIVCQQLGFTSSDSTPSFIFKSNYGTRWLTLLSTSYPTIGSLLTALQPGECPSSAAVSVTCAINNWACGRRSANISNFGQYIINGQFAQRGAWPWQVMLLVDGTFDCGGSLINDRWILTAAHCTRNSFGVPRVASQYLVRLGSILANGTDTDLVTVPVDRVFTHPFYNASLIVNDIGLLRLSRPVTFTDTIRPICLPDTDVNLNKFKVCVSTGFGRTNYYGSPASRLMQARMDILPLPDCYPLIAKQFGRSYLALYNATVLCLGPSPTSDIATCKGDSGGPLACQDQQGLWTVIGVTSFGLGFCSSSFDARVPTYVEWIQNILNNNRY